MIKGIKNFRRPVLGRRSGWVKGAVVILTLMCCVPAFAQLARRKKAASAATGDTESFAWGRYLVQGAAEPTFRFAVAHQHKATGCVGYLYISRREISYLVKSPPEDRDHGFRYSRASLEEARQWRFLASAMPEVEFKFAHGKTYHFFRVRETVVEAGETKLRMTDVLPWEPLAQAALHFDEVLALAQRARATQAASSGGPKIRVMEPAVTDPSVPVEVAEPILTLRGAAFDSRGVLSVTVNGRQAELRSSGDIRAVEFSVRDLMLQDGLNRLTLVATNVDHQSAQLIVPVWLRSKGGVGPAQVIGSPAPGGETTSPPGTSTPAADTDEPITVEVFSEPSGADILVDNDFVGNTPSILKLKPGKRTLTFQLSGYKASDQTLDLPSGSPLKTVRVTLEKTP